MFLVVQIFHLKIRKVWGSCPWYLGRLVSNCSNYASHMSRKSNGRLSKTFHMVSHSHWEKMGLYFSSLRWSSFSLQNSTEFGMHFKWVNNTNSFASPVGQDKHSSIVKILCIKGWISVAWFLGDELPRNCIWMPAIINIIFLWRHLGSLPRQISLNKKINYFCFHFFSFTSPLFILFDCLLW